MCSSSISDIDSVPTAFLVCVPPCFKSCPEVYKCISSNWHHPRYLQNSCCKTLTQEIQAISSLSFISKIPEKLVKCNKGKKSISWQNFSQTLKHIHNTETTLMKMRSQLSSSLDLRTLFDTIDQEILIRVLKSLLVFLTSAKGLQGGCSSIIILTINTSTC